MTNNNRFHIIFDDKIEAFINKHKKEYRIRTFKKLLDRGPGWSIPNEFKYIIEKELIKAHQSPILKHDKETQVNENDFLIYNNSSFPTEYTVDIPDQVKDFFKQFIN